MKMGGGVGGGHKNITEPCGGLGKLCRETPKSSSPPPPKRESTNLCEGRKLKRKKKTATTTEADEFWDASEYCNLLQKEFVELRLEKNQVVFEFVYTPFLYDFTAAVLANKTRKYLPCWCIKSVLRDLNSFL